MGELQPLYSRTIRLPRSVSKARNRNPEDWVFWDSRVCVGSRAPSTSDGRCHTRTVLRSTVKSPLKVPAISSVAAVVSSPRADVQGLWQKAILDRFVHPLWLGRYMGLGMRTRAVEAGG
jgi:hypothetical protein